MNENYLERIARAIDPVNAEYIVRNRDIVEEYCYLRDRLKAKHFDLALYTLKNLKRMISQYGEVKLLPTNVKVGDGVTVNLWTDRYAATIIKVTKCSLTVRRDRAIRDPEWMPKYLPGGFSAYCFNNDDQRYIAYEPDEAGSIYTFRWSGKYQRYGRPGDLTLSKGRHEFYDYNF